jgi:uracil phosphoribosyltransferase
MFPNLRIVDHPLVQHKLARLRDRATVPRDFKSLVSEISVLIAYEATKDLPVENVDVDTPLERTRGTHVSGRRVVLVPILRAGLGMVDGLAQLLPNARMGHIGLYRDHDTLEPVDYYFKIPGTAEDGLFYVLDPMLATGGSAVQAVTALKRAGATRVRLLCLVAAPSGAQRMFEAHPDVIVYTAALDRGLNDKGYILPGLGDAGDRMFGTE